MIDGFLVLQNAILVTSLPLVATIWYKMSVGIACRFSLQLLVVLPMGEEGRGTLVFGVDISFGNYLLFACMANTRQWHEHLNFFFKGMTDYVQYTIMWVNSNVETPARYLIQKCQQCVCVYVCVCV